VKPTLFEPKRERRIRWVGIWPRFEHYWEVSTYRIGGLTEPEVMDLGDAEIGSKMSEGRRLYGFARLLTEAVTKVGLRAEPDNAPPRHVGLVGWPDERFRQLSLQQALAAAASRNIRGEKKSGLRRS